MTMTKEEREICLTRMRAAAGQFYLSSVVCNNPKFTKFAELMTEYINACATAHANGIDFSDLPAPYGGTSMPMDELRAEHVDNAFHTSFGDMQLTGEQRSKSQ